MVLYRLRMIHIIRKTNKMPKLVLFIAVIFIFMSACTLLSAQEENMENTASVSGIVIIPADLPSFAESKLEIRLYKFDPLLADRPAQLIDRFSAQNYSHIEGKTTKTKFELGSQERIDPAMRYYITVFILSNDIRTHIGEKKGKQGLFTVLSANDPRHFSVWIRPVKTGK